MIKELEAGRGVGRCSTEGLWWEGNRRARMIGLRANRLASLPVVSQRGAGMGWGECTAHCRERDQVGPQDWDYSREESVSGQLPVVRSSGESVCRASMMSEKVP